MTNRFWQPNGLCPKYELHFHLQDGTVQKFGYSCGGATFIRGEQDFWEGEDFRCDQLRCFDEQDAEPPAEFEALIEELSAAETEGP